MRPEIRRRWIVGITLVVGAALLGLSLTSRPGSLAFYPLSLALATVWCVGAIGSGPLRLGRPRSRTGSWRPAVSAAVLGLLAAAVFIIGALIVREVPALNALTGAVLDHAQRGLLLPVLLITIVNGVAEELFFRGALFAAAERLHPVLISTGIYTLTTMATGNAMLVFASLVLGLILGRQRQVSGTLLGPIITHVIWSTTMLLCLPLLISGG